MTEQQYDEKRKQILFCAENDLKKLDIKYASELKKQAEIGDIITDGSCVIKVTKKLIYRYKDIFNKKYPKFVYEGTLLTKKGVPRKDGVQERIYLIKDIKNKQNYE